MATASIYLLKDRSTAPPPASASIITPPPPTGAVASAPAAPAFNPRAPGSRKYRSLPLDLAHRVGEDNLASGAPSPPAPAGATRDREIGHLPLIGHQSAASRPSNGLGTAPFIRERSR